MSTNGNRPGQGGGKRYILIGFLALAIGAIAVYAFSSSSSGGVSDAREAGTVQTDQPTSPAAVEQNQPSNTTTGTDQAQEDTNNGVNATATIIATDDPSYMDCLNHPNAEGETNDQHIANCNKQLEKQQARQEVQNGQARQFHEANENRTSPGSP